MNGIQKPQDRVAQIGRGGLSPERPAAGADEATPQRPNGGRPQTGRATLGVAAGPGPLRFDRGVVGKPGGCPNPTPCLKKQSQAILQPVHSKRPEILPCSMANQALPLTPPKGMRDFGAEENVETPLYF